eukprot:TRINITY_DN6500_c0_g1_i6.p1 TRINITY_DN6500_c0_g1~~TRINITY_DN6500_c0_g1_i6.p1  ORF type:complete len:172 (+),score=19.87 TRINITY_DN6500_c0_g1_i6:1045-1560(+)
MSAVYPLFHIRPKPSLPPIASLITMQDFALFIKDKTCFYHFYYYVTYLAQTDLAASDPRLKNAPVFLEYYMEYITNQSNDPNEIRVSFGSFLHKHRTIFPAAVIPSGGSDTTTAFAGNSIGLAFNYCAEVLQEIFTERFLKTAACMQLLKMFRRNENIEAKLADLKMISVL